MGNTVWGGLQDGAEAFGDLIKQAKDEIGEGLEEAWDEVKGWFQSWGRKRRDQSGLQPTFKQLIDHVYLKKGEEELADVRYGPHQRTIAESRFRLEVLKTFTHDKEFVKLLGAQKAVKKMQTPKKQPNNSLARNFVEDTMNVLCDAYTNLAECTGLDKAMCFVSTPMQFGKNMYTTLYECAEGMVVPSNECIEQANQAMTQKDIEEECGTPE